MKKYGELCSKITYLITLRTNNSDDYDGRCMEIKFNSDDDLPLNKTLELRNMIIIFRSVFHEGNKYCPQVFLDECLYKLQII